MEDYVKTGEDKKFEYYRNDSEVLLGDGEEESYEEIINKRDKFNVKINDKELLITKRTLNKIMILSDSQPEEQILFSLYKTISHGQSPYKIREQPISNDKIRQINKNDLDDLKGAKGISLSNIVFLEKNKNKINPENNNYLEIEIKKNESISKEMTNVINNFNTNESYTNEKVNNTSNEESDNEEVSFKKVNNNNYKLIFALPPQAVRIKWFYLLLSLLGIAYIILFICGLANEKVGFIFNNFCMCIIGVLLLITGIFGFSRINNRIYDNNILLIFTIICMIFGIIGIIIVEVNKNTKRYLVCSLSFGILTNIISLLCIIWTLQLKIMEQRAKQKQMEKLVDKK